MRHKTYIMGAISLLTILTIVVMQTNGFGYVPQQINYQGYLTDNSGNPVNGDHTMTFTIYNADSGGTGLWTETQTVSVADGVYNVILGQPGNEINPGDIDGNLYLGVTVGSDDEMTPRQSITATAFSLRSALADDAGTLDGLDASAFGDITGVSAGIGLLGGGTSGTVTVNADFAGSGSSATIARSDHIHSTVDITSGTLSTGRYSAYSDLSAEGYLGNASGDIARNNGTRQVNLNADLLDGLSSSAFMNSGSDNWVNVTGDTMTGTLNLPANGLRVGTSQLIVSGGRVGLGTSSPNEQLEITGNFRLPTTTSTSGIIRSGEETFIHNYGLFNTFVGEAAGNLTMSGIQNTAVGVRVLDANTAGDHNTAVGVSALGNNLTGNQNTACGLLALLNNTEGSSNTAIGMDALYSNTTGDSNTAIGQTALYDNRNGYRNTAVGLSAGRQATGSGNIFIGYWAGRYETGSDKLYIANSGTLTPLIWGDFSTNVAAINGRLGVNTQPGSAYQFHSLDERSSGRAVYAEATGQDGIGAWGRALGDGGIGIYGTGNESGAYFKDSNSSGLAYVGYDNRGIWAKGTMAGGTFSHPDNTTHWADVSTATRKIQGTGTVSFVQNHPYDDDMVIVYAAPEGDEVGVYTRGTARLVDGEARVMLGETFQYVANPDIGLTVYLTPVGEWSDLYIAEKTTEAIVIRSAGGSANGTFDYLVYGLRLGFEEVPILQPKEKDALLPTAEDIEAGYGDRPDLHVFNAMERYREMQTMVTPGRAINLSQSRELMAALEAQRSQARIRSTVRQETMQANREANGVDRPHPLMGVSIDDSDTETSTGGSQPVHILISELREEIEALKTEMAAIRLGK